MKKNYDVLKIVIFKDAQVYALYVYNTLGLGCTLLLMRTKVT